MKKEIDANKKTFIEGKTLAELNSLKRANKNPNKQLKSRDIKRISIIDIKHSKNLLHLSGNLFQKNISNYHI